MVDTSITVFLIAIVLLVGYFSVEKFTTGLVYTKSSYDDRMYLVRNLPDRAEAANLLARLRERLVALVEKLKQHYQLDKRVVLLVERYNPDDVSEVAANSTHTSYSVNKGEKIVYCIRSRDKQERLTDLNTIMFVAMHELAHVMTLSVGHTQEFWENFRFILSNAIHWKLYRSVDFRKSPRPYCGTYITDSPLDNNDARKYVNYEGADDVVEEDNDAYLSEE